jgi:hypothetical protein
MSPGDVRAAVMAVVRYVDARKQKELQELLSGPIIIPTTPN